MTDEPQEPRAAAERFRREREERERREWRRRLWLSLGVHLAVIGLFAFTPGTSVPAAPVAMRVSVVSAVPAAKSPGESKAVVAKAAPRPQPAPAPKEKPKPKPKADTKVLPKQAPKAVPKKKPQPRPEQPTEELELDDALDRLRGELGETAEPTVHELLEAANQSGPRASDATGSQSDGEVDEWRGAVQRHVRKRWITPPEFLNRGLKTLLAVMLTSDGTVLNVRIERSSGDPFADDNAVRALRKASPLPPPPEPGENLFSFVPETRQ